ncbi:hypothetical protein [Kiloniella spongiae]|nr:hypothetical protein [Kiloniella spongiae]
MTARMINIMKPVLKHLLVILIILVVCLAAILFFPGSIEAFGAKFWDAALWIGSCFS